MSRLRRNQVVMEAKPEMFRFYGRVNRRIDDERVEVIDCGKHVTVYRNDELEVVDYEGYWDTVRTKIPGTATEYSEDLQEWFGHQFAEWEVWRPMPSLRRLKQRASCYNKSVWKKNRKKEPDHD